MTLLSHAAVNYRNLADVRFSPDPGVNVISGLNGQGKTNLLESIYLLTGARSFRGAADAALIRKGAEFSLLDSRFLKEGREQTIRLRITGEGRKAGLNGVQEKGAALSGVFCCVVFSPEHLTLVKGPPEGRRRFIDAALSQISPSYLRNLRTYARLIAQRNALLRECAQVGGALDILDVLDAQFLELARSVTNMRRRYCLRLSEFAKTHYMDLSDAREELSVSYLSTLFDGTLPEEQQTQQARLLVDASRAQEIRAGYTLLGPHRDDLKMELDGADAKLFASQGQQRCAVLSLKLAEAALLRESHGEQPVLLLDDVLSELDASRQDYLIDSVRSSQSVITSCAPELIAGRAEARIFTVRDGNLEG